MQKFSGRVTVVAAVCVATVGLAGPQAQAASNSGGIPGTPEGLTLWQGKDVPCTRAQNDAAWPGAVLRGQFADGCERLGHLLMTVRRPREAQASPAIGGNGWQVDVALSPRQRREFARVTDAEVGHELAMVLDGRLLSAPTVMDPITTGHFQIVALPRAFAEHLARRLNDSD